jgi:parallel beta-helix repeat protein
MRRTLIVVVLTLGGAVMLGASGSKARTAPVSPAPVSGCQTLGAPGTYALTADIAVVDASCISITASDVTLDLAGHTISCTGTGFGGSCQVPTFESTGVLVASSVSGVSLTGPGTIAGFDNGVVVEDSNALVKGITVTGPGGCDPASCSRPISNGILALGLSGVNLIRNEVSNYAFGLRLIEVQCPGGSAACVLNGNTLRDNNCVGIQLPDSTGYTLTQNVARANGSDPCFPTAGIGLGGTGHTLVNNDSSNNFGFGIAAGPGVNGNTIANNTARGNTLADLRAFPGTTNTWNNNNRCNTESGEVPTSVCNPGE